MLLVFAMVLSIAPAMTLAARAAEIERPQGRIDIRGTTLLIPLAGNHSSDSDKPYPCNGGGRAPLLTVRNGFTEPTQEADRTILRTGLHQPPAL